MKSFDQFKSFLKLKQFSEKYNFETKISIPLQGLQESTLQLRALGKALQGISTCHTNKHVQQSIKIQGKLNYICTSFFQEFKPNPEQREQPLGSTWVQISGLWAAPPCWYLALESRHAAGLPGGIREGQPGSCQPKRTSYTSSVQDKRTWISLKNLIFSSHTNYGKKLLKVRFHYIHPKASSCVRLILSKNTLSSQHGMLHQCFCSLSAPFPSMLTSPSVVVLAVLGQAGTPRGPGGHGTLGRAGKVTHLGAGRGRTLAKLPIHWSGN